MSSTEPANQQAQYKAGGRETAPVPLSEEKLRETAAAWGIAGLDPATLSRALMHASALEAHSPDSNERLEFLGDSIVNASAAHYLYNKNPAWTEGDLAKGRALVVSKPALYEAGVRLGLQYLIVVGSNFEGTMARGRRSLVSDAVEAVVAAVYLQFGWERARGFVLTILAPELESLAERADLRDAKTILQERSQSRKEPAPSYRIIAETGEPHARVFTAEVQVTGGFSAVGTGRSKKDAEQAAAAVLLRELESSANL